MKFTIFGANGFIGSYLQAYLQGVSIDCYCPGRDESFLSERDLGHVIYCIGMTADFRNQPFKTVDAHVANLSTVLASSKCYDSFLYLSSTRVYTGAEATDELTELRVKPTDPDYLYNISKIMGESLCLALQNPKIRVARLSNVIGRDLDSPNFLPSILREAIRTKEIKLQTTLDSTKDYIGIEDTVQALVSIALNGTQQIYNVANGINVSNQEVVNLIKKETDCSVHVVPNAIRTTFPPISVQRLNHELGCTPRPITALISDLVNAYQREATKQ
jgi:nucleoside-diphosphate-sugar epimerase